MAIKKTMKLLQVVQTAKRSQATFGEEVKQEPGKATAPGKVFSFVTDNPKDLEGLVIDKVYTISIS